MAKLDARDKVQPVEKSFAVSALAVAIGVFQNRDLIRARGPRGGGSGTRS